MTVSSTKTNTNNRVRVKVCGITRLKDAQAAIDAGVDALGFVFYPRSPRYIHPQEAQRIIQQLPAFVSMVGLFMDASATFVGDVLKQTQLDLLQFHGKEMPEYCEQFQRPYIKSVPMLENINLSEYAQAHANARAVLLDSTRLGQAGGTGDTFDWQTIPEFAKPVVLAGGLNPRNVGEAIQQSHCYAVDCSSGVESSAGIKCAHKMQRFMQSVASAV